MSKRWFVQIKNSGSHNGFEPGDIALSDLRDGLNVVYAPNASGKSTLAAMLIRALGLDAKFAVSVRVHEQGEVRSKDVVGRGAHAFSTRPERPGRYHLDVVELLKGLSEKEDTGELDRIVGSGIHLMVESPKGYEKSKKDLSDAKAELEKETAEGLMARELEAGLPAQHERLEKLKAMNDALGVVKSALENQKHKDRCEALRSSLAALEAEHVGIEGQSAEWLKSFLAACEEWESASRVSSEQEGLCRSKHLLGSLPSRREASEALDHAKSLSVSIGKALDEQKRAVLAWDQAKEREMAALAAFYGFEGDWDAWSCLSPELLDQLKSILHASDSERKEQSRVEGFKQALNQFVEKHPELDAEAVQRLQRGVQNLTDWLESASAPVPDRRPIGLLGLALVGALLVALPLDGAWRMVAGAVVALAALAVYVLLAPKQAGLVRRQELEKDWGALDPRPGQSTPVAVAKALRDMSRRLAEHEGYGRVRDALRAYANQSVEGSRFEELRSNTGLALKDPYQTTVLFEAFRVAVEAYHRRVDLDKQQEAWTIQVQGQRTELAQAMTASGFGWGDHVQPESAYERYEAWHRTHESWLAASARAHDARQKVEDWLKIVRMQEVEPEVARVTVLSRTSEAERYHKLRVEREGFELAERATRVPEDEILQAVELAGEDPLNYSLDEVHAVLEQESARRDTVRDKFEDDKQALAKFRESKESLARAKRYSQAYEAFRNCVLDRARYAVCTVLDHHIRERVSREATPEMIRMANDVLGRTTQGRYKLQVKADQEKKDKLLGPLEVWDHERRASYLFGNLSTGTKVHTILALKLGWLRHGEQETGSPAYPIVVDEPMAVSDVEASKAIAEVLAEAARDRQVIVFTNQPEDVLMLREASGGCCHEVSISGRSDEKAESHAIRPEQHPVLIRPAGPQRFRLGVPVRSHSPAAVLPPDDRIPNDCPSVAALLSSQAWAQKRFGRLVDAITAVSEEIRSTKNRLDPSTLRYSGLTPMMLSQAQELLERCGRDPDEFLGQFRNLEGAGDKKQGKLRAWMEREGHLVPKARLSQVRDWAGAYLDPEADREDWEWLLQVLQGHIVPE